MLCFNYFLFKKNFLLKSENLTVEIKFAEMESSLTKLAAEEELRMDLNEIGGDQAVKNKEVGGHASWGIFPPELWELILNEVGKSEDIQSVLLAFPELGKALQSKKAMWLFGAVLPHLMTKHLTGMYKSEDVFTLRLVSKRWKASVESSLASNSALKHLPPPPRKKDSKEDLQKLMPSENHFSYHSFQQSSFGASCFRTSPQIDKFLIAMTNHSGNPFPGRYVAIKMSDSNIDESLALFEKFGEHVLFLDIWVKGNRQCHLQLCRNVLMCLSHVPNLRSLTVTGSLRISADKQTNDYFGQPEANNLFPELPNLEAFILRLVFRETDDSIVTPTTRWIVQMIQKYGGTDGLGKLGIPADYYEFFPPNLTSLTEINMINHHHISHSNNMEAVEGAFNKLPNPHKLRKVRLEAGRLANITEMIAFLAGYQVESLLLEVSFGYGKETMAAVEAPSITSLHVKDVWYLDYKFVKLLPNLQFLTINFEVSSVLGYCQNLTRVTKSDDSLGNKIRAIMLEICYKDLGFAGNEEFSIWKELPKLQMFRFAVTTSTTDAIWNVQFVRECGNQAFFFGRGRGVNDSKIWEWNESSDDYEDGEESEEAEDDGLFEVEEVDSEEEGDEVKVHRIWIG